MIQYGFATMFVVAFPIAPLFALINNVVEIRLDAKKYTELFKRPIPINCMSIGMCINFSVNFVLNKFQLLNNHLNFLVI